MRPLAPIALALALTGCASGVSVVALDLAASYAVQRIAAWRAQGINYVEADEETRKKIVFACAEAKLLMRNATTVDPAVASAIESVCDLAVEVAE